VYTDIKNKTDIVIGLTHLTIDDDKKLASELPQLKLIMGGHEHVNMKHIVGETVITKADANAKTVYVHTLHFNADNKLDNIKSELINIDNSIPEQPQVKTVADEWTTRAFKGFYDKGFDAFQLVIDLKDKTLDGREETVRTRQNELGNLIARAMMSASPNSVMAVFNSGSIRIDDELRGEVTQYDIIRTMPFGGKILQVEMKGELLQKILEQGTKNRGAGGYLLYQNAMFNSGEWLIGTFALKPESVYNVAINDFLMSGMEKGLGYLTKENPGIIKIHEPDPNDTKDLRNDIRFAVIEYMKKMEN
jgi:5'-nucleotidase